MVPPIRYEAFQQIWERALEDYAALVPKNEWGADLNDKKWLKIKNVDDLLDNLAVRHADFKQDTGRDSSRSGAMKITLNGIGVLIGIFGGAAGAAFPPCSQVLGAVTVLIETGKRVSGAFDSINSLFDRIGQFMMRLKPLSAHGMHELLVNIAVNLLVCTLRICAVATRKSCHDDRVQTEVKNGKRMQWWRRSKQVVTSRGKEFFVQLANGGDPEIENLVSQVKDLVDAEGRMTVALTNETVNEISEVTLEIQGLNTRIASVTFEMSEEVHDVKVGQQRVETKMDAYIAESKASEKKRDENASKWYGQILEAVKHSPRTDNEKTRPPNSSTTKSKELSKKLSTYLDPIPANSNRFNKLRAERAPGTGEWILKQEPVKRWLAHQMPILIVSGEAGLGKTFLATRIVEELQKSREIATPDGKTSSAYFFCRNRLKELCSVTKLLKSLAFQVTETDKDYARRFISNQRIDALKSNSVTEIWKSVFHDLFQTRDAVASIVIDGLNECQAPEDGFDDLVKAFAISLENSTWLLPNLHLVFFVETKSASALTELFGEECHLTLDNTGGNEDLKPYVQKRMKAEWEKSSVPRRLRNSVLDTILSHPNGNFLWSSLVLEEVTSFSREEDILALLNAPPSDIPDALSLALVRLARQLDKHGLEDLDDLLAWVYCSHRYMTLAELDGLLALRGSTGSRLINLQALVEGEFSALFVTSKMPDATYITPETIQRRLGEEASSNNNPATVAEKDVDTQIDSTATPDDFDEDADFERKIDAMDSVEVRLADKVSDMVKKLRDVYETPTADRNIPVEQYGALCSVNIHVKTLLGCLDAVCRPSEDTDKARASAIRIACEYCAAYLPEHLGDVKPTDANPEAAVRIVKFLVQLLRDEATIDNWVAGAGSCMTHDLLRTDMDSQILAWFQSVDVQKGLPPAHREWTEHVFREPPLLFLGIAKGHARRWLQKEVEDIAENFRFINHFKDKLVQDTSPEENTPDTVGSNANPGDHDVAETDADQKDYGLSGSSADDIVGVARWANLEETSQWKRRVGFALEQAGHYQRAVEIYSDALAVDADEFLTYQRLGVTYWLWSWSLSGDDDPAREILGKGLEFVEQAAGLYDAKRSTLGIRAQRETESPHFILSLFYRYGGDIEKWASMCEAHLEGWETEDDDDGLANSRILVAGSYLCNCLILSRDKDSLRILDRIRQHVKCESPAFLDIYTDALGFAEDLFQFVYRQKQFPMLDAYWQHATRVIAQYGKNGQTAAARWYHADAILRFCPSETSRAMTLLKKVADDEEVAATANDWHWIQRTAQRELSRLYLMRACDAHEREDWIAVGSCMKELRDLAKLEGDETDGFNATDSAMILAVWYRLHANRKRAKQCARPSLERGVSMLYDLEPDNDCWAWAVISDATLAVGDTDRARAAMKMLRKTAIFGVNYVLRPSITETADDTDQQKASSQEDVPSHSTVDDEQFSASETPESSRAETEAQTAQLPTRTNEQAEGITDPAEAENKGSGATLENNETALPAADGETIKPPEDGAHDAPEEDLSDENTDPTARTGGFCYTCDGPCAGDLTHDEVLYRCSYCIADFCEDCCALIKQGQNADFDICSKAHEWIAFEPCEKQDLPKNMMRMNGELVPIVDWLNKLAEEWDLPRRRPNGEIIESDDGATVKGTEARKGETRVIDGATDGSDRTDGDEGVEVKQPEASTNGIAGGTPTEEQATAGAAKDGKGLP